MKTYKNLWDKLISDENIREGIYNATHGNMKRKSLERIKKNPDKYIEKVRNWITDFKVIEHTPKVINDGITAKKREIIVPTVQEHTVQHCLMNILRPIFMSGMYEHSYASVPNRGCHKGKKYIEKWIRKDRKNCKYCLKIDVKKYFQSVNTEMLKRKIFKKIKDKRVCDLIAKIISINKKGLPLGFYTSQWFANFYLQSFDHYVKERLSVKHYVRYMDDMVFFHSNKRELHRIRKKIETYLKLFLNLKMKSNWQLFRFHTVKNTGRFLDFMGFKFYLNRTTLRRCITLKAIRKARRIWNKVKATVHDARQMLTYKGWVKCTDTRKWFATHILPKVSFDTLRLIVSKHDKEVSLA